MPLINKQAQIMAVITATTLSPPVGEGLLKFNETLEQRRQRLGVIVTHANKKQKDKRKKEKRNKKHGRQGRYM